MVIINKSPNTTIIVPPLHLTSLVTILTHNPQQQQSISNMDYKVDVLNLLLQLQVIQLILILHATKWVVLAIDLS